MGKLFADEGLAHSAHSNITVIFYFLFFSGMIKINTSELSSSNPG